MANLKITTHTTYTYETTDGREFDYLSEAEAWQTALDNAEHLIMLDSRFNHTKYPDSAFYVYIKDQDCLDAFNTTQADLGLCARVDTAGYYYYDDISDNFKNIDKEVERLLDIKNKLNSIVK